MIHSDCRTVGIDLGTSKSALAYVDDRLIPRVVTNSSGSSLLPSAVLFEDDRIIVGEIALKYAWDQRDRLAQFSKVLMGEGWRREYGGWLHSPESISAILVAELVKESEPQIGPIRSAVITVPACFTEKRRRATQQAGEIAGLNVIGTLNEPMAAVLAHGLHRTNREEFLVVYSLGGGALDVTVLRISPKEVQELATAGDSRLGGRDWDQALVDFVADIIQKEDGIDLRGEPHSMQRLGYECERAKCRLSALGRTVVHVPGAARDHQIEITREQFEQLTAGLLQKTEVATQAALAEAGLNWDQVSRVTLVGGSTRMPSVRQMIERTSAKTPDTAVNPELGAAIGAAIYGHILETGRAPEFIEQRRADEQDVDSDAGASMPPIAATTLPHIGFVNARGVGLRVRAAEGWRNVVVIPKNTPLPISVVKRFVREAAGSGRATISIPVTQGDTCAPESVEDQCVASIESFPPGEQDGQPVDVTIGLDDQGRFHIHAVYVPSDQKLEMSLQVPDGLDEKDVEIHRRHLLSADKYASLRREVSADIDRAELADVRNEAPAVVSSSGDPDPLACLPPVQKSSETPRLDENVQFTVYYPKAVRPQRWYDLLAAAHLEERRPESPEDEPSPILKVQQRVECALGPKIKEYKPATHDSTQPVPQGAELTFVPEIANVQFNPTHHTFRWMEDQHTVSFRMLASVENDGKTARGGLSVFLGAILVANIPLRITVDSGLGDTAATTPDAYVSASPYRNIFASYAHEDAAIVEQFEAFVETMGDRYLRDCRALRAGQEWNAQLMSLIEKADVFQLFWSRHSMVSLFVRQEWEYAMKLRRQGRKTLEFVRPVFWEDPFPEAPPKLPPEDLRQIHFQRLGGGFKGHRPIAGRGGDSEPESDALPSAKRYYIRSRGRVSGPFTTEELRLQAKRGRFRQHHQVSLDRVNWERAALFPELIATQARTRSRQNAPTPFSSQHPGLHAELEQIAEGLNAAYGNLEVEEGRRLRCQWRTKTMASGTTCDEALLESVGPALDWLSETDRQQTALAEFELNLAGLERALDEGASLEELTRLAHKCFHSDRGLPDEIQRRLEDRFQNLEVSVKRRSSCLVSIVVITVLLIGMLAGLAAYYASM